MSRRMVRHSVPHIAPQCSRRVCPLWYHPASGEPAQLGSNRAPNDLLLTIVSPAAEERGQGMATRTETKVVTGSINGISVTVPAGTTILEAARQAGIEVPNLCYQPLLRAWGSCRICTV